jgi:hypothetical protein
MFYKMAITLQKREWKKGRKEGMKAGRPVFKIATFTIRFYTFETRICAKCGHLNGARKSSSWFYCASFVR